MNFDAFFSVNNKAKLQSMKKFVFSRLGLAMKFDIVILNSRKVINAQLADENKINKASQTKSIYCSIGLTDPILNLLFSAF